MFNRILVPLDGSSLAEGTIPYAEYFAHIFGGDIFLFHVLDSSSNHENPNYIDPLNWQIRKAEADIYMKGIAERVKRNLDKFSLNQSTDPKTDQPITHHPQVKYVIEEGKTAETIISYAFTENMDLIIISTHGSSGLSRWNISSVTQKILNQIYLPVLLIRSYAEPVAENEVIHFRHVLLPIDRSRRAEHVISAGIALIQGVSAIGLESENNQENKTLTPPSQTTQQTKLILATVLKPPEIPIPEPYPIEIGDLVNELMRVSRAAVVQYMQGMKAHTPLGSEVRILENNSVFTAIQDLIREEQEIDLVILSAHGYTGLSNMPYGSIAHNYVQYGTKPALIIQDLPRALKRPTTAELMAEKLGRR